MRALAEGCASGLIPAEVGVVISPIAGTPACEYVLDKGLTLAIVPPGDAFGERLLEVLVGCSLVCLAGFTRLVPGEVLEAFPGSVLNIHPALLPKFGGKGMYGSHVHEAVLAAGELESGCTVHLVTPVYDEGEVVLQVRCQVQTGDTAETLASRVLALEHAAYPEAVRRVIDGRASRGGASPQA